MNKSKFLKKSLAMLLALMLVVAMIPLSASAALPDDLVDLYVNGGKPETPELTASVSAITTAGISAAVDNGAFSTMPPRKVTRTASPSRALPST